MNGERPWKGISFLVLEEAGVRIDGDGTVHIPYRHRDGRLHRERVVRPSGKRFWDELAPGEQSALIPFGCETLPDPERAYDRVLFVTEGESDALALREAFADVTADSPVRGYHALGVPGSNTWKEHWRFYAEGFLLVYVLGDGDSAGQLFNAKVCRSIPDAIPVPLSPGEDVRSILMWQGTSALEGHLDRARRLVAIFRQWRVAKSYDQWISLVAGELAAW